MAIQMKKGFVLRKIGPRYMAVPYGAMAGEIKGMISLTESGYVLWQALTDGVDNKEKLVDVLLEQYDVDPKEATQDVDEFLAYLAEMGVLET